MPTKPHFWPIRLLPKALAVLIGLGVASASPPGSWGLTGQTADSTSSVTGRVEEHETGAPLAGAAVSLASGPGGTTGIGTRVTGEDGRFRFRSVPRGTYRLVVTLLGYQSLQDTLIVGPVSELDLILPLSVAPIPMEPIVVVSERRNVGFLTDFEERRRTRHGTFFDQEYIDQRRPTLFTDLLRMVPGARVVPESLYGNTVRMRGGCTPALWVDGTPLGSIEGMDDILPTMDLAAVEVYHGVSLPYEFGMNSCGAIVVWTKRGEPSVGEGSLWKRLALAAGFIALAFLLTR